jgi:hypothetical protein
LSMLAAVFADGTIVHKLPSQCSVNVRYCPLTTEYPAAQQFAEDVQETPNSSLGSKKSELGEPMMDQDEPFQCSISVWTIPVPGSKLPTAQQSNGPEQVTAFRTFEFDVLVAPVFAEAVSSHDELFQWTVSVWSKA